MYMLPEITEKGTNTPQIWSIKNNGRKGIAKTPTYTFSIFDSPGEDIESNLDPSSPDFRYISISKAIILTIDPLILANVRKVVDPNDLINSLKGKKGKAKNAKDAINNVVKYIKIALGKDPAQILDIPLAVVLTKFDTVVNHKSFGSNAVIRKKSEVVRNGQVDVTEIKEVDGEIRNWLKEIGEGAFINTLDAHFKEFYFFGVSSFGRPPKNIDTLSGNIKPHRVLDPIFWIFKKFKFVD